MVCLKLSKTFKKGFKEFRCRILSTRLKGVGSRRHQGRPNQQHDMWQAGSVSGKQLVKDDLLKVRLMVPPDVTLRDSPAPVVSLRKQEKLLVVLFFLRYGQPNSQNH